MMLGSDLWFRPVVVWAPARTVAGLLAVGVLSGCVCPGMQPRRIGINAWADRLRMTRLLPQVLACIMTARLRFHMKRIDV